MPESRWIDPGRNPERPVTLAELSRRIKVLENIHKDEITLYVLDTTGTYRAGGIYYYKTVAEAAKHILQHPTQNFEMRIGDLCEDPKAIDIEAKAFSRFDHPNYGASGDFSNLCKVYLGPTETIATYAFSYLPNLNTVEFPKVINFGKYAFKNSAIKKLYFPKTVEIIEEGSFQALNHNGSNPYTLEQVEFEKGGTANLIIATDAFHYNGEDMLWHSVVLPERTYVLMPNSIPHCWGLYCVKADMRYEDKPPSMGWTDSTQIGGSGRVLFIWDTVDVILDQCDANGILLMDDGHHPEYHMEFDTKKRWTEWTEQSGLSNVKIYAQLTFQHENDPDLYWGASENSGCRPVRIIVKGSYGIIDGNIIGARNDNMTYQYTKYIDIEEGVTEIRESPFARQSNLIEVNIPSTMTTMSADTFKDCTGAFTINVNKAQGTLANAPWGAVNATVNWLG